MRLLHQLLLRQSAYLWLALIGLIIAIYNPKVTLSRDFHNYMFVIDITQSMNVEDMQKHGLPISRLNYTLQTISSQLKELPCDSKVSIALFGNGEVVPLFNPIDVCSNFGVIQDTLSHIEWRMAWRGSSHLRLGLIDAGRALLTLPEPVQIVFFTDGDEAAPINAITKIDLLPMQGSDGWLLVGIGSDKPVPVPKFNSKNEIIGYWSQYAIKIEPSQIVNEESTGKRDDSIALEPREYYLTALREDYLKEVAKDIGASYIRAELKDNLMETIKQLPPAGNGDTPIGMGWIFALLSGLFVLADYMPSRRLAETNR